MVKLHNTCKEKYFKRGVKLCHRDKIRLFVIKQAWKAQILSSMWSQHVESPYLLQGSSGSLKGQQRGSYSNICLMKRTAT